LDAVPKGEKWAKARIDVGLKDNTVAGLLLIMSGTVDRINTTSSAALVEETSSLTLSEIVRQYAYTTYIAGLNAQSARCSARFRELILASLCELMIRTGKDKGDVNLFMRECFGDKEDLTYRRLRGAAPFVNKCVLRLLTTFWNHRASELIFICMLCPKAGKGWWLGLYSHQR
jgi:hypothetical protein